MERASTVVVARESFLPRVALLPAGALAVAAFLAGASLRDERAVLAMPVFDQDSDHDGLSNPKELVLGTSEFTSDTDRDGFSDLEELARGSDPLSDSSIPTAAVAALGMAAHAGGGLISSLSAVYLPTGSGSGLEFGMGLRVGLSLFPIAPALYMSGATIHTFQGATPGTKLVLLESVFPQSFLTAFGSVSLFSMVKSSSSSLIVAASVLELLDIDENPVQIVPVVTQTSGGSASAGALYRPLGAGVSTSWSMESVCEQTATVSGSVGPMTILTVSTSSCEPADAYCPPDCSNYAGSTITLVDPLALIGG